MKYIYLVIAILMCFSSSADDSSEKLLSLLSSKLNTMKAYDAKFHVLANGDDIGDGEYSVNGELFHIKVLDKEIYSDGKIQYDVNNEEREVVIDNIDSKGGDVLTNPATAFSDLAKYYTHTYSGEVKVADKIHHLIKLKAKDANTSIVYIDLYLNTTSNLPYKIIYKINDSEDIIEVVLNSITKAESPKNLERFRFKSKNYKDYELIDFR